MVWNRRKSLERGRLASKGIAALGDKPLIELVRAAREGDRSALGELLESFRSYLRLFSDRQLGPDLKQKCGGSDLVQQTFLDAQQAFPRFVGSTPDELRVWLERILLNNLGDLARQFRGAEKRQLQREVSLAGRWAEIDTPVDWSTPSKRVIAREEEDRLRRALARIPEDYRRVIVMRNLERRRFEEIGVVLGRSTGAVKKLWSRAILRLKDEMKAHERP
jgi:RNA polymerase sigma-70 factor (ECF subfamily)